VTSAWAERRVKITEYLKSGQVKSNVAKMGHPVHAIHEARAINRENRRFQIRRIEKEESYASYRDRPLWWPGRLSH
jgi:hypothetical protein